MQHPPLPARFAVQLGILSNLYAGLMARLLDPHGLTYPQFMLLLHLDRRKGDARISDIARAIDLTQPAVTKIIQKFVAQGWVSSGQDARDQRSRPVRITEAGRAHAQTVQRSFAPAFATLLNDWQPDDIARLTEDLMRLSQTLDQMKSAGPVRTGG